MSKPKTEFERGWNECEKSSMPFVLWVCFMVAMVFGVAGCNLGSTIVRGSAIEAGVAVWTVDPKTGKTEFRWTP